MLAEFEALAPKTLAEALQMMSERSPDVAPIAGGTNLVVDLRSNRHTPAVVMNIEGLPELTGIRQEDGWIVAGGCTTLTDVLECSLIQQHAPCLWEAAYLFANPLVRNRATLGGNLVDASPAADTAPSLLALGVEVELTSLAGSRTVPLAQFFTGVRKTVRRPDELLTAVRWPVPPVRSAQAYYKLGLRKADAISVVSAAVLLSLDESGDVEFARIALGSVAPTPVRAYPAEDWLRGRPLDAGTAAEAGRLAVGSASPIGDLRASADYRRRMIAVLTRRLLLKAAESVASHAAEPRSAAIRGEA